MKMKWSLKTAMVKKIITSGRRKDIMDIVRSTHSTVFMIWHEKLEIRKLKYNFVHTPWMPTTNPLFSNFTRYESSGNYFSCCTTTQRTTTTQRKHNRPTMTRDDSSIDNTDRQQQQATPKINDSTDLDNSETTSTEDPVDRWSLRRKTWRTDPNTPVVDMMLSWLLTLGTIQYDTIEILPNSRPASKSCIRSGSFASEQRTKSLVTYEWL